MASSEGATSPVAGGTGALAPVPAPEGARRAGDVYYAILGRPGLYNADAVRTEMGEPFASVKLPAEKTNEPAFEFVEL